MKLTVVLFLVFASVAVLRADEERQEEDDASLSDVYDGTLEDEVLGNEDDPANYRRKQAMVKKLKHHVTCAQVFGKCMTRFNGKCKLVKVCKMHYYACRCILKGVGKCRKFLRVFKMIKKKYREHDESEVEDVDDAKRGGKWRKWKKIAKKCKRKYKSCKSKKGKNGDCRPCIKLAGKCVKKSILKHVCRKNKLGDEPVDEEEDEAKAVATLIEHDDNEEDAKEVEEDESEDAFKGKKAFIKVLRKCGKRFVRCMLRAKMNCRRQGRCVRRVKRCVRRKLRKARRGH